MAPQANWKGFLRLSQQTSSGSGAPRRLNGALSTGRVLSVFKPQCPKLNLESVLINEDEQIDGSAVL
jgi:hypothetical protein